MYGFLKSSGITIWPNELKMQNKREIGFYMGKETIQNKVLLIPHYL